ncbi:MAG: glycosyltransferase family 4 protein [Thermoflexales bacterium]|nr:glycosyltransferase family 4 protein [Thermoflexales bacterium]
MRILHASAGYAPFVGGAQAYLQALAERFARDGDSVTVASTTATQVDCFWNPGCPQVEAGVERLNGVEVRRCRLGHLPLAPWSFYLLRRLAPLVSGLPVGGSAVLDGLAPWMPRVPDFEATLARLTPPPELVHGVNIALEWPLIAAGRYARRCGAAFVTTPLVHVGDWEVQRNYTMRHQLDALAQSDAIIVLTPLERDVLVKLGLPPGRIVCTGAGVDLHTLRGGDAAGFRARHAIRGAAVTFMGTLTYDKGVIHLCEAARQLWRDGVEMTLVLAGRMVSPGGFDEYYKALPDEDRARIRVLGAFSEQSKQDMLAATDVFAMPSRIDSFGIVYLEAWAYGKPVIGARAGGVPAVIAEGETGLLVEFGDVGALAAAIRRLLDEPALAQKMGARGQSRVRERHTWEGVYRKTRAIYQIVTGQAQGPLEQVEHGLST